MPEHEHIERINERTNEQPNDCSSFYPHFTCNVSLTRYACDSFSQRHTHTLISINLKCQTRIHTSIKWINFIFHHIILRFTCFLRRLENDYSIHSNKNRFKSQQKCCNHKWNHVIYGWTEIKVLFYSLQKSKMSLTSFIFS